MKFLIIDDSKVARILVKNELEPFMNADDIILEASNGKDGINLYKEEYPDICFVDLTMPVMDGIEVIDNIRKFHLDAFLVVLTADVQKIIKNRAFEAGIVKYCNKPLKKNNIEEILKEYEGTK